MFKYVKEFFKTLFMEFKGVKTRDISFDILTMVKDFPLKEKIINIYSEEPSVCIQQILVNPNVRLRDIKEETKVVVKKESMYLDGKIASGREMMLSDLKSAIKSSDIDLQTVIISKDLSFRSKVVEGIDYKTNVNKGDDVHYIKIMRIKREKKIDKNKVLDTLARFLNDYEGDLRDFEFIGYYRKIPIGHVEKISVSKKDLMVYLKKRGKNLKVDVLLIKLKGAYRLIPVRD